LFVRSLSAVNSRDNSFRKTLGMKHPTLRRLSASRRDRPESTAANKIARQSQTTVGAFFRKIGIAVEKIVDHRPDLAVAGRKKAATTRRHSPGARRLRRNGREGRAMPLVTCRKDTVMSTPIICAAIAGVFVWGIYAIKNSYKIDVGRKAPDGSVTVVSFTPK
jgi:hypothetical protein